MVTTVLLVFGVKDVGGGYYSFELARSGVPYNHECTDDRLPILTAYR